MKTTKIQNKYLIENNLVINKCAKIGTHLFGYFLGSTKHANSQNGEYFRAFGTLLGDNQKDAKEKLNKIIEESKL